MQRFAKKLPLSPHVQIYRLPWVAIFSISHRLSGIILFFGLLLLSWRYALVVLQPHSCILHTLNYCLVSKVGIAFFMLWTMSFYLHLLHGIRHLFWDFGIGFKLKYLNLCNVLIGLTIIFLTVITWFIILYV